MPGRSEEHPLRLPARSTLVLAVLAALLAAAAPIRAQEDAAPTGLLATAGLRLTTVAGEAAVLPGGGLLLRLGRHVELGGGGWALTSRVDLDEPDTDMAFGYGGVMVRLTLRPDATVSPAASLLVGAGNASLRNAVVDVQTDAENALVVEPELALRLRLGGRAALTATGGWRLVTGVDRSVGIEPSDLGGPSASLSFTLGPF